MSPILSKSGEPLTSASSGSSSRSGFTLPPKSAATLAGRSVLAPPALCLLCASSLPSTPAGRSSLIETSCCRRTICGTCITDKGRAARWDPCLFCSSRPRSSSGGQDGGESKNYTDGHFVLGDDDDDDEAGSADEGSKKVKEASKSEQVVQVDPGASPSAADEDSAPRGAIRHIVRKGDTLIGIALKYGVDPHHLCTLNRLPHSTLHTTPHLVQTRSYILLLPSPPPPLPSSVQTQIAHERAIARFGKVTKEEDAYVRQTYVGLAELDRDAQPSLIESGEKEKPGQVAGAVEDRAVDAFFEDRRWETEQGGQPRIPSFPVAGPSSLLSTSHLPHHRPAADTTPFDWTFGWGKRSQSGAEECLKIG